MKTIYLVRHAKSSWDDPALPDMARPLNKRGQGDSDKMGIYLFRHGNVPQIIISSPATRAIHTAINLSSGLHMGPDAILTDSRIYFEGPDAMLKVIRGCTDDLNAIMLVGHDPDIGSVAEYLSGEKIEKFPTCAVYVVIADVKDWKSVDRGNCRQREFLLPRKTFS